MTSNMEKETSAKRPRIMIIIDDESIIDQVEQATNILSLRQNIFPSNTNNIEMHDKERKIQSSDKTNKPKNDSLICVVCGSSAFGYNFGAIACESCKAFFRRNSQKKISNLYCKNKGGCQITMETRRCCVPCRLAKCFNNGMTRDRLSTDEQKALKYRKIEENRHLTSNSVGQINQEELQLSVFTCDNSFPSIDTNILLTDFTDLLLPEPKQTLLTSDDFQRIEYISFSYQKRIELANRDGLPWDPSTNPKTLLQFYNSQSVPVMRILAFFKQIPEFNELNVDDKVILIKYNLPTILGINSVLHFNTETNQVIESDSDTPRNMEFFRPLHGYKICMEIQKAFSSFLSIAKYDRKIIEITLIILILTKCFSITSDHDEQTFQDNRSIYHAQNYYIELLWKHMEAIHGYKTAFDLFSQLIGNVLSWQILHKQVRNDVLRTLSPEDIDQLLPIMKSLMHA